jgi:exodeoxyribonuclease-3
VRLITWNVNSLRPRLSRLLALLEREQPDVVCLQETKAFDDELPSAELRQAGYVATSYGQRPYNGVAILSHPSRTRLPGASPVIRRRTIPEYSPSGLAP